MSYRSRRLHFKFWVVLVNIKCLLEKHGDNILSWLWFFDMDTGHMNKLENDKNASEGLHHIWLYGSKRTLIIKVTKVGLSPKENREGTTRKLKFPLESTDRIKNLQKKFETNFWKDCHLYPYGPHNAWEKSFKSLLFLDECVVIHHDHISYLLRTIIEKRNSHNYRNWASTFKCWAIQKSRYHPCCKGKCFTKQLWFKI